MFILETRHGNDGYAFWFKTLELLAQTENHFYDCNNPAEWEYLLATTRVTSEVAENILDLLASLGGIDPDLWDKRVIWSKNFVRNLEGVYARRRVHIWTKAELLELLHTKTPRERDKCIQKPPVSGISDNIYPQSKVKRTRVYNNLSENEVKTGSKKVQNGSKGQMLDQGQNKNPYSEPFLSFWNTYPRKEKKGKAYEAWKKHKPPLDQVLNALSWQTKLQQWKRDDGQFIPLPATYLNARQWEDEPPKTRDRDASFKEPF